MNDPATKIHTVLTARNGRCGLAIGIDSTYGPFRIWLQTPRAVQLASEEVQAFARSIGASASWSARSETDERRIDLLMKRNAREWRLA